MIELLQQTPVETYMIEGQEILVKREDRATPPPGPPFSKIRGLVPYLEDLKASGYRNIGYVETSISMAGWGVAWVCYHIDLHCIIWDPQYKETPRLLNYHRKQWSRWGAETRPIPAGMAAVNFNIAASEFKGPENFLLPLGLPLPNTVTETAKIARETWNRCRFNSVIVSVGSGTICAGLLLGLPPEVQIYGVMCRTGIRSDKKRDIYHKAGLFEGGLLGRNNLHLADPGWQYTDKSTTHCPFPTHPYYDLKSVEWMKNNMKRFEKPIMFWNIGRVK